MALVGFDMTAASGLGNDCYGSGPFRNPSFWAASKPLHHTVMGQRAIWPATAGLADNRPDQAEKREPPREPHGLRGRTW
jgi:hypothetical protein